MLAVPLTDYYEEVRRYLTCPEEVKDDLIYDVNRKVMDLNADRPDLDYNGILEFLGDPEDLANSFKRAISTSNFYNNGVWIGTVSLQATFSYNSITAGVVSTDYSTNLASGWSYKNHKITTTTVSSSNGGTATLTATLKKFPLNVAVRLSLHCSPDGTITRG